MNRVKELENFGQSIWLDYIRRSLLESGELKTLIDRDGLKGMTSNPAIFEKALGGAEYGDSLREAQKSSSDPSGIYETVAVVDIRQAADILRPVYESTRGADGYVSLEVSPRLAHETEGTVAEARRLWAAVGRPNLMIKVPATPAGIPAIQQLISEGLNINVTLLFSVDAYAKVADAYIEGLEGLAASGKPVNKAASVASFFVSRIDSLVDKRLESITKGGDSQLTADAKSIMGRVAIANAKLAYLRFQKIYSTDRWAALASRGARKQRLLWASTGTKNPAYRDTLYVEELIGPDTVNTLPPATLDAFRDHGEPRASLLENLGDAQGTMDRLEELGIDFEEVTDILLTEGLVLFDDAFNKLLSAIEVAASKVPAGR